METPDSDSIECENKEKWPRGWKRSQKLNVMVEMNGRQI